MSCSALESIESPEMKKIALVSLGCAKNLVDSEVMLGFLEKAGYAFTPNPEEAHIIIVNTCGFIAAARQEAVDTLRQAIETKKKEKAEKVIAAGCYVERDRASLQKQFPEIDIWTGVSDFDKIAQMIEGQPVQSSSSCYLYDHTAPRRLSTPPTWAYVKISEGCSHECAFCAIPLIKGPYQSRSIPSITEEVEQLAAKGIREINLISQDSTYFGREKGLKDGLVQLLSRLVEIKDIGWIRILYGYPEEITDSLLEVMEHEKICPYLDIPFQHADPKIIRLMKRGLDGPRALRLIAQIRRKVPDIALRTSLVVGFPGEDAGVFKRLKRFVQDARFDHLGVFTYSLEERTACSDLGDTIPESVKNRRRDEIMSLQAKISLQANQEYVGRRLEVLLEGAVKQDSSLLVGRTRYQAPEVDGVVFIERARRRPKGIKAIQEVEITAADDYDLYGTFP